MVRLLTILALLAIAACTQAFVPGARHAFNMKQSLWATRGHALHLVSEVSSEIELDEVVKSAGESLVIVDYSTTWCGPCKVMEPKFVEMSDKYPDAVFLKVIGDSSPTASRLMKREGVRSVPSFHYWKGGERVDIINGANQDAIEAAVVKHL